MPETVTFIVGNGLGMAIDPERFSLSKAMDNAQKGKETVLEKYFDATFPANGKDSLYTDEAHLRDLQRLLWAHDEAVINLGNDRQTIAEYFTKIVWQFFEPTFIDYTWFPPVNSNGKDIKDAQVPDMEKGRRFLEKFSNYIKQSSNKIHVTTLNYDRLLYTGFIRHKVIKKPYKLIDGFLADKNHNNRLIFQIDRCRGCYKDIGLFLHLHGSPLFFHKKDNPNITIKNSTSKEEEEIRENAFDPEKIRHIVLTYPHFKQRQIEESPLLSAYWQKFQDILKETSKLVLIGYGGGDPHLNEKIRKWVSWKKGVLYIVEHDFKKFSQGEAKERREMYWQAKFMVKNKNEIKYIPLPSILDFDFKKYLQEDI